MNKEEFLDLVWRLGEILMHRDHLQNQIDSCEQGCGDDEGLCPVCNYIFMRVQQEDERLAQNKELEALLKK